MHNQQTFISYDTSNLIMFLDSNNNIITNHN